MMRSDRTTLLFAAALVCGALVLAGCGTRQNAALDAAKNAYRDAASTPDVTANAPVQLHEAEAAVTRAEDALRRGESDDEVDTLAYVAQKRVEIARTRAEQERAEADVKRLDAERSQVLVGSRTAEAEHYRAKASQLERELASLNARETKRGVVVTLGDVLFDFNKASLRPGSMQQLNRLAAVLREHPDRQVLIEGHTDAVGSPSYNRQLSEARAEAVRDYLTSQGIAADRVVTRGYGESYPVASNASQAGRLQNRRVEVTITPPGAKASASARAPAEGGGATSGTR
ncbi:MAG TPA: OmpA family protein [Candidatus Binatia bacterium]|nr:OmpA family protein [Candidatus Binatia bacterium]